MCADPLLSSADGAVSRLWSPLLVLLLTVGCAGEVSTPTPDETEALARAAFPQSEVRVNEVTRTTDRMVAPAEFNGVEVELRFRLVGRSWELESVEQGDVELTPDELRAVGETMQVMQAISGALASYRDATGDYPLLDDQVGLRELVPDHYAADASLNDRWDVPLRYRRQGSDYTLTSAGPDGLPSTQDDIVLVNSRFENGQ